MRALALLLCVWPFAGVAQEFTTLKGHGGPIMGLAVAPNGDVVSASFDNSVGIWTDAPPNWLEGHDAAVVTVNTDQYPLVLSGGDDFRALLWHPDRPAPIELPQHKGKVADIAVHPKAGIATASWDGFINITQVPNDVTGAQFETHALKGHRSNVTSVGFSPDGVLFSSSSDGTLRVWEGNAPNMTSREIVGHGFGINKIIVAQTWIAYGAVDGGTRVIDHEGQEIADFTLDRRPVLAMAYHEETNQIAVGDGHGYIMMIDSENWRITRDFRAARRGPVWALAFSPDGETIYAGGLDDVIYAWPVDLLHEFDAAIDGERSFLRAPETMANGERQFMRKCSICHALEDGPSRKAGPHLHKIMGRRAGALEGYNYSPTLDGSDIIWTAETIDALFDEGPDNYIPGSKMPMQVITGAQDRADLVDFLNRTTTQE